jgi:ABC-type branched-subunit amino acid transport system ATPase component
MLVIDHNMTFMRAVCDRMVAFHDGRHIFSGPPDEVLSHPDVVESYLGAGVETPGA